MFKIKIIVFNTGFMWKMWVGREIVVFRLQIKYIVVQYFIMLLLFCKYKHTYTTDPPFLLF